MNHNHKEDPQLTPRRSPNLSRGATDTDVHSSPLKTFLFLLRNKCVQTTRKITTVTITSRDRGMSTINSLLTPNTELIKVHRVSKARYQGCELSSWAIRLT